MGRATATRGGKRRSYSYWGWKWEELHLLGQKWEELQLLGVEMGGVTVTRGWKWEELHLLGRKWEELQLLGVDKGGATVTGGRDGRSYSYLGGNGKSNIAGVELGGATRLLKEVFAPVFDCLEVEF